MEIPISTLQEMLNNAATLGAMSAVKKLDPVKDQLKASEVRTWLDNDSNLSRKFDAMVRKGMIKGFKKRLVQPSTGLPPSETGYRNSQSAGKAVGCQ